MTADPGAVRPDVDVPVDERELVERFTLPLRAFAARRLRDASAAEEVAQETFRRALEALRSGRIREPRALPSFLFETARNVCRHRLRGSGREGRAMERLAAAGPAEHRHDARDALATLVGQERRRAVARALADLPAADRHLLHALFHHEERPEDLAGRLGLTPGALRVRKHRALGRLRARLQAAGVTPGPLRDQNG